MKSPGYTLLEIVLVAAILGIAALVVGPSMVSHEDEQKIVLAANEVQDALRYARSAAQRDNRSKKIEFNTANESFSVLDSQSGILEIHPSSKNNYLIDFSASSLLAGVDIVSIGALTGLVPIIFLANGHVGTANQIVLTYGSHKLIVNLDINGRASLQ